MPGKRKNGKTKFGVWLTPEEFARLRDLAGLYGKNMCDLVKQLMDEAAKKKGLTTDEHNGTDSSDSRDDGRRG